jgi:hypothetical protein
MGRIHTRNEVLRLMPPGSRFRGPGLPQAIATSFVCAGLFIAGLVLSGCATVSAAPDPPRATAAATPADSTTLSPPVAPATLGDKTKTPVLLIGIGMHIEPFGSSVSSLAGGPGAVEPSAGRPDSGPAAATPRPQPDYNNPVYFERSVADIETVVGIVEEHGGLMTVQAQSPFTTTAVAMGDTILADLQARGHEIALHFHEDAHLGANCEDLPVGTWAAVMAEEIGYLEAGGAGGVRYWSGGNLYPGVLEAAHLAGLDVMSDYKNPHEQSTDPLVLGVNPWRPAGGPLAGNLSAFAQHDPEGEVVYLPDGAYDPDEFGHKKEITAESGEQGYFDYLEQSLDRSLAMVEAGKVGVFHITLHPGELRGSPADPYAGLKRFLTEVVDPLVAAGKVEWATFSQMADVYRQWEAEHPAIDARAVSEPQGGAGAQSTPSTSPVIDPNKPCISFVINSDDFRHVEDGADTVLRLTDLFERYGIRGDFYFTAPLVAEYVATRPDVVTRLRESDMTISYHHRAPHPLVSGFEEPLQGLSGQALSQAIRDYETYGLDLETGLLDRDRPGGYLYVAQVFGRAPVTATAPNVKLRAAALPVFASLGAQATIVYHETGTDPDDPFEYVGGLLVRPSDFSITRWSVNRQPDAFWWNMLGGPLAPEYDPLAHLKVELDNWEASGASRQPFITVLIHEGNFHRQGAAPWGSIYYADKEKTVPLDPPYHLDATDLSRPRTQTEKDRIWQAYEELVAWAAENLNVVTSADIVQLAEIAETPSSGARTPSR